MILISIDTLRSDRLPAYGHAAGSTPAIDDLARDAILFERAYSHYPLTLPSHASVFSGLLPPRHGVRDNVGYPYDGATHPTLASLLGAAGYETAAIVSAFVLRRATGIGHGFELYDDAFAPRPGESLDSVQRPGRETARRAIAWLQARRQRPFLLFVHLYEPHAPYLPPAPFATQLADRYDGEVAAADAAVGEIIQELRRLDLYDRSLVVLFSDHGEALGDHGGQTHGVFLYREALQVPLLVKLPGSENGGRRVSSPARLVDVFPTVLDVAGAAVPPNDGLDLLELSSRRSPPRPVYAETWYPRLHFGWSELSSWIDGDHHYIEGPAPELFDLAADPQERVDLFATDRRRAAELRRSLATIDRRLAPPAAIDAEDRAALAALGYTTGPAPVASSEQGTLPDPKTQLHTVRLMEEAYTALGHGHLETARDRFERLLAENPRMADISASLAQTLQRLGRHAEAADAFERAIDVANDPRALFLAQAESLIALERYDEAEIRIAAAGDLDLRTSAELGMQVAFARGDLARAQTLLSATALDDARAFELRGLLASRRGDLAAAEAALGAALALDPERPEAWALLGRTLHDRGRRDEALEAWRRAVALDSGQYEALFNFGVVAHALGREDQARAALARFVAAAPRSQFAGAIREAEALLR